MFFMDQKRIKADKKKYKTKKTNLKTKNKIFRKLKDLGYPQETNRESLECLYKLITLKYIKAKETLARLSTLNKINLKGGVVYHDGQFDDARLAINIAQSCIENGATLLNHFKVQSLKKSEQGIVNGLVALDTETGNNYDLKARVVVNATGVFTDEVLKMDEAHAKNTIRPSQGIHLVVDAYFLAGQDAIMIPKTTDGRVLFLVPWHNKVVVGTTDTLLDSHSLEPKPLEEEINFILQTANQYLNKKMTRADVRSVFAGLRPLAAPKDANEKTKEISRSHKIIVSDSQLITITGGKWTSYRKMAQDTVNKIIVFRYNFQLPVFSISFSLRISK